MFKTSINNTSTVTFIAALLIGAFCIATPLSAHAQSAVKVSPIAATRSTTSLTPTSPTAGVVTAPVGQADADMESAVRSVLAADPRAAALPPAQLNAMVQALSKSAESKGLQASDIHLPPAESTIAGAGSGQGSTVCGAQTPTFLCALATAFGLDGSNAIPLWLGGTAALLILLIGTLLEIHHLEHKKEMEAASAPQSETQSQ